MFQEWFRVKIKIFRGGLIRYRQPPNISPGLIFGGAYIRRFTVGLIGGSVVEFSRAMREAQVRFLANAFCVFFIIMLSDYGTIREHKTSSLSIHISKHKLRNCLQKIHL